MDIQFVRSVLTVVVMAAFFGIAWWAYGPSRKARFERDGLLPFEDDPSPRVLLAGGDGNEQPETTLRSFPNEWREER